MHRIDNSSAATTLPTPSTPGTPGYFTGGNPSSGQPATVVAADWMNAVQEEIGHVIESANITLSKTDRTQLLQALTALSNAAVFTTNGTYRTGPSQTAVWLSGVGAGGGGGGGASFLSGGVGGCFSGGGGSAGQVTIRQKVTVTPSTDYAVTLGAGGVGGTLRDDQSAYAGNGAAGGATDFGALVALVGGAGGGGANVIPGTGSPGPPGTSTPGLPVTDAGHGSGCTTPSITNGGFAGGEGGASHYGAWGHGGRGGFASVSAGTTPTAENGATGGPGILIVESN